MDLQADAVSRCLLTAEAWVCAQFTPCVLYGEQSCTKVSPSLSVFSVGIFPICDPNIAVSTFYGTQQNRYFHQRMGAEPAPETWLSGVRVLNDGSGQK